MNDLKDEELFELIKDDDKSSYHQIYKKYWSELFIYAFNVLQEREICEDIIQEIFVDLWERGRNIQISNLKAYLYQSVKHQIFNHFRRSKYKQQLLSKFDQISEQYKIDELYEEKELKHKIDGAILKLPDKRRMIFQMSRYGGLSNREISENLNISIQTVKNQISESLKFIRKSLKDFYLLFF